MEYTYTIYHILGEKIGLSRNLKKRLQVQGFTEYEVLEIHTCIYEASRRELELQAEYGYPVDTIPYWKSIENSGLTLEGSRKGGRTSGFTNEQRIKGGKNNKGKPKQYPVGLNLQKKKTCPHCDLVVNAGNYTRWHGDNCKLF